MAKDYKCFRPCSHFTEICCSKKVFIVDRLCALILSATENEGITTGVVLCKKLFLNFTQNSQENNWASVSSLIKLPASANLLKNRLWHRCFPVNFVKFSKTPFSLEHLQWLFLKMERFHCAQKSREMQFRNKFRKVWTTCSGTRKVFQ